MYIFEGSVLAKKGFSSIPATAPTGVGIVNTNGIEFPAAQVSSSNVNTLDDYEEGDWTPIDSSGAGFGAFTCDAPRYTKIGRVVIVTIGSLLYPVNASVQQATVGGLPVTVGGAATWVSGGYFTFRLGGGGSPASFMSFGGSTTMLGYEDNGTVILNNEVSGQTLYGFSMTYFAAT